MKKLLLALLSVLLISSPVAATTYMPPEERNARRNGGIVFHNGRGFNQSNACLPLTGQQPGGTVSTGNTSAFLDRWHDTAVQLQILYGIPWEGAMAQAALESGWGTSHYARTKNAYFGVNAVDTNPDLGYAYATPELSWYGQGKPNWSYAEFIRDMPRYRKNGAFNHVNDPIGYVRAVAGAGYATAPNYAEVLINIINNIIRPYSASKGWPDSAGVTAANPEAAENATKNAKGESTGVGGEDDGVITLDPCEPGTGSPIEGSVTDGLPVDITNTPVGTSSCPSSLRDGNPHLALDFHFGQRQGVPIYTVEDGTVSFVGTYPANKDHGGYGYYIIIDHAGGYQTYYAHLLSGSAVVSVGDKVTKGQPIARNGDTGWSTGPHLHYEVRVNGNKVNPNTYIGDYSSIDQAGCSQ